MAHLLQASDLWHFNRRSVSGAVFIGLFCAYMPIPSQMVVAALLALATRVNLPLSVGLVWVTNPLTIPPMFYFSYRVGAYLLDMQLEADTIQLSFDWIWDNFGVIGYPLLFGSVICGMAAGVLGYTFTRLVWRLHVITRWRERRARLRARKMTLPPK